MEIRGDLHRSRVFYSLTTLFLMFCLLATSALAGTTIEISPSSVYEGTTPVFNVTVITSHSSKSLTKLDFTGPSVSNVEQTNSTDFNQGWNISASGSTIFWENNTIPAGSFVIYTYLQFTGTLSTVSSDSSEHWTITTTDSTGKEKKEKTSVTILNDASPPVISNPAPAGSTFLKPAVETVSATITDPESGVGSTSFAYGTCGANTTSVSLTANNTVYSSTADLSSFNENDVVCYTFTATSNGGESSTSTGNFTIDNTAPSLSIVGPADDIFTTGNLTAQFDVSDTLSPTVTCDMLLNGTVKKSVTASQSSTNSEVINTTDGSYAWQVQCSDLAGNTATSTTRTIKIDNTPPTISYTHTPSLIVRGKNITATASITDFSGISDVRAELIFNGTTVNMTTAASGSSYTFTSPTTTSTALGEYQIKVYADDTVSHTIASTTNSNVTYDYVISLGAGSSSVTPGGTVSLTGNVSLDDGSIPAGATLQFILPNSTTSTNSDNQTGVFSHSLSAPSSEGTYTLLAQVTAANGITYNQTITLTVQSASSSDSGDSGSATNRNSRTLRGSSPGRGAPSSTGAVSSIGSSPGSSTASSASAGTGEGSTARGSQGTGESGSSASPSSGSQGAAQGAGASVTGGAVGVGAAGSFIQDRILKYSKLLWTVFVVMLVIGSLVYISRGPQGARIVIAKKPRESKPPKVATEKFKQQASDLDDYLRKRLK